MIKEIKYNGCSANPSDYQSPDGDLLISMNAIPEDGAIKRIGKPKVLRKLQTGSNVIYVHSTGNYSHYIIHTGDIISWTDASLPSGADTNLYTIPKGVELYEVNAIGNTLLILTSDGMFYFLWKDASYISLGNHFPELDITFGLQATVEQSSSFTFDMNFFTKAHDSKFREFPEDVKDRVTDAVLAQVNKFIQERSVDSNRFIYPFFVRYGYRLYDGSVTMHSAPILMMCSGEFAPQVYIESMKIDGAVNGTAIRDTTAYVCAALHSLDYGIKSQSQIDKLKLWEDIVTSVDIFITPPIYTYDQNGKCQRLIKIDLDDDYSVCKLMNQHSNFSATHPLRYQYQKLTIMLALARGTQHPGGQPAYQGENIRIQLPSKHNDNINEDIQNKSVFRYLHSLQLGKLTTTRTVVPIKNDFLKTLETHEPMSDDYRSHDRKIPTNAHVYNSRLNLSGVSLKLFRGFENGQTYTDGFTNYAPDTSPTATDMYDSFTAYVYINENGKQEVVTHPLHLAMKAPFIFYFYPNVHAYKMVAVARPYTNRNSFEVKLKPHGSLNGAYYFASFKGEELPPISSTIKQPTTGIVSYPNKIYTSEVNNPFKFSSTNTNSISSGTILGICTAAKALSEGQFGQFPLYAFTTEGVWALEVSSTGSYSAKQPITRDVCISPESITQIDNAVLFATDRGIMLLSGSTSTCISDVIENEAPFSLITELPKGKEILNLSTLPLADINIIPFKEFLKKSQMLYDYTHQHIIVYNNTQPYAYVFSLHSKQWGMIESDISSGVNSYPEALAMDKTGNLINFSDEDSASVHGLLISRPMKLDEPDVHKTISAVIQRGQFSKGDVKQILYGSNDLLHWFVIKSSVDQYLRGFRGTPYKYFRIALICSLDKHESISGCSIQYEQRMTNKLR